MDLMKLPRPEYSIGHFARPMSWELDGKTWELVMDDGYDVTLCFRERKLTYARAPEAPSPEFSYFCFKGDDTTFFVSFEVTQKENHVFILDLSQRLVTHLICEKGVNPRFPQVIRRTFCFGAIRMRG